MILDFLVALLEDATMKDNVLHVLEYISKSLLSVTCESSGT